MCPKPVEQLRLIIIILIIIIINNHHPQPNSLQLVAIYGLVSSVAVLIFCAWIGHLVDRFIFLIGN